MALTVGEKNVIKSWLKSIRTGKINSYEASLNVLKALLTAQGINRMVTQVAFDFLSDIGDVKAPSDDLVYLLSILPENKKPAVNDIKKYVPEKNWPSLIKSSVREEKDNGSLKLYVDLNLGDLTSIIPDLKANMYEDDRIEFDTLSELDQSDIMNDLIQDYFHTQKIEKRLDDECWDYISEHFDFNQYVSSLKIDEYPKYKNLKNAVLKLEIEITVYPPQVDTEKLEETLNKKFKSLI